MTKMLRLMVLVAIMLPMMLSCSGDGDKSIFGSLPKVYNEYMEAGTKLYEELINIKTDQDNAEYLEKSEKLQQEWSGKIEQASKSLDGKVINFGEGDFKVTEPISFQFKEISQKGSLSSTFNFNGSAEAASDIILQRSYYVPSTSVYMIGYDAEGQEIFKERVGKINVEEKDGQSVIPAGTPIKFDSFSFGGLYVDKYDQVTVVKLEVNK